jgi:hypothetical protein
MNPNPYQPGDNYFAMQARVIQKVQSAKSKEVLNLLQSAYQATLDDENLVLSRAEKQKLFQKVLKTFCDGLLNEA